MNRRKLITGLVSFIAAPAIVKVSSLMPIKAIDKIANHLQFDEDGWTYRPYHYWKTYDFTRMAFNLDIPAATGSLENQTTLCQSI
jgi:hypothetical protein